MSAKNLRALVTGANGLLATHIILELIRDGVPAKGLIRDRRKFQLPDHPLIELAEGDVTDRSSVEAAMFGCTHVVHAAALTSQHERDYREYERVNVTGTDHLVTVAIAHHIQRFVLVSTANTLGYGSLQQPGTEQHAMCAPFTNSLYARSKVAAEQLVDRYASSLDVVIVHPTFMLGAYDAGPSSGQIITTAFNKQFVLVPPGGKNFIHVRDAAKGLVCALWKGKRGEHYLLANENISYYEFFQELAQLSVRRPIFLVVPAWILRVLGGVGDLLRATGIKTALSSTNMTILTIHNYYDGSKAKKEWGLEYRSIRTAVQEAVDWFQKNKMI